MSTVSEFSSTELESICNILGDTHTGLTGSEIGKILARLNIPDPSPNITKRRRLFDALSANQAKLHSGNNVCGFIQEAMSPVSYISSTLLFSSRRNDLNIILAFCGYYLGEDGKIHIREQQAHTLNEAEEMAGRLRSELVKRRIHPDVLKFCRPELLQDNYFHAVFEATKSVADKIRKMSDLDGDGSALVDQAFGMGKSGIPILAFNSLQTENERSEHNGLMQLIKGMFGIFRNVTAHAPKIQWTISEQDALDLLTIASYLHRRIDVCIKIPKQH